jgi:hypothetical protein
MSGPRVPQDRQNESDCQELRAHRATTGIPRVAPPGYWVERASWPMKSPVEQNRTWWSTHEFLLTHRARPAALRTPGWYR